MEKQYLYDGLTLIAQTNVIGNTIARYHYGDRYQLAENRNNVNSYFHVDSLGTNVAVTDVNGGIQSRYEYDAFGNVITQAGSSEQPFGFTGYQKDEETGLYYANARYYDSSNGRFLREDPFDGSINTPPSLHRYLYANANPTVFIDPTGEITICGGFFTCVETDDILSGVQSTLNNNESALKGNLQSLEAESTRDNFTNEDVAINAGSRLVTEFMQGLNGTSKLVVNAAITSTNSQDLKSRMEAEQKFTQLEESLRNSILTVSEDPVKAGGLLLKSAAKGV